MPLGAVAGVGAGRGLLFLAAGLLLHRLAEAIAFAVHLKYLAVMRQTIQERRRHPLALKDLPPVAEREVARDQQALPLVAVRKDLKQQLRPGPAEREVAQFLSLIHI